MNMYIIKHNEELRRKKKQMTGLNNKYIIPKCMPRQPPMQPMQPMQQFGTTHYLENCEREFDYM